MESHYFPIKISNLIEINSYRYSYLWEFKGKRDRHCFCLLSLLSA